MIGFVILNHKLSSDPPTQPSNPSSYLYPMIQIGEYNTLTVQRELSMGLILDDGGDGILLPKRFAPKTAKTGDQLKIFLYHDSEDRLIATTQQPKASSAISSCSASSASPRKAPSSTGVS